MIAPWKLAIAYSLDLLLGDPEWFPHPVRLMGAVIHAGSRNLTTSKAGPARQMARGTALSIGVITASAICARKAIQLGLPFEILLASSALATRSLLDEANAVLKALDAGNLAVARSRLARIVGRDTDSLDEAEIARAVIETAAESTCDGIVAPLMYLAGGGVPAALAYKAVNTLDSMIGHKEPPFTYFGRCAARFDDVCNFLPARVAALAIVLASGFAGGSPGSALHVWWRDRNKHASPNAGQVEAAMAGALGVRLGGLNTYDGNEVQAPILNPAGRTPNLDRAHAALRIVTAASALVFGTLLTFRLWKDRHRNV